MAESATEKDSGTGISRRKAIKSLATVGGATAGVWYLGGKDVFSPEGLPTADTPDGVFHILYEDHRKGILLSAFPKREIDFFFKEGTLESPSFQSGINLIGSAPAKTVIEALVRPELIAELARRNTKIVFADVLLPPNDKLGMTLVKGAEMLLGVGSLKAALELLSNKKASKTGRRTFIKALGVGGAALLVDASISTVHNAAADLGPSAAIKRILGRINALSSHFHPEDAVVLLRNAIWAHKLLNLGRRTRLETNEAPVTICNVGAAHQGLEDFLQVGSLVSEMVILAYQKDFLATVIEANLGVGRFCSSFIVQPSLTEQVEVDRDYDLEQKLRDKLNITDKDSEKNSQELVVRDFIEALQGDDKPKMEALLLDSETYADNEFLVFVKRSIKDREIKEIRWLHSGDKLIVVSFKDELPEALKLELSKMDGNYRIANIAVTDR